MVYDIQRAVSRLVGKAPQLIGRLKTLNNSVCITLCNFTTNLAESWMHIRCKFDGGKQINRIQSGSWQARCAGAGLRCNMGPSWGPVAWEKAVGTPPLEVYQSTAEKAVQRTEQDRKRKATEKSKAQRKKAKYSSAAVDNSITSRRAYSR